ncbi:DUF2254 family protein [Deinococcus radiophilus]|uniref:DUF2254 domain-containing protein n=1 Tax=Deinococcus radiophilus TaxID=32062 RepID=A0A431VM73_9DEIO|nr:DUF2254 family protein [Deinococcus radiophilus]RTR22842.1 DUF2254 domain-containing protein [Deinococcus radiophilus]UFA50544.1 DUF2254 domain-containing protein [Deinococcus radiophilus]
MQRLFFRMREFTEQFWFIPALMTATALLLAELGITLEEQFGVPRGLAFVYTGGEAGARSVLGAIASSSIGTAGTIFSITIAALSFSASSMGPRLLEHFTHDRGNQITLGIFIGTFTFTLYSLRAVTGGEETPFVPHDNVTAALVLAVACVAALVYFLAHATRNINMTQTINLLREDMYRTLERSTLTQRPAEIPCPDTDFWEGGEVLRLGSAGG